MTFSQVMGVKSRCVEAGDIVIVLENDFVK